MNVPSDERLREELAGHLEALAADFERQGLSPHAARRAARLKLGGDEQIRIAWREARRRTTLERWGRDLRRAARGLRRSPGYAAAVVCSLALAIGVNTAIFTLADAVLLRPLPYAQSGQLQFIRGAQGADFTSPLSYPNFRDWRDRNHSFTAMAAFSGTSAVLTGRGAAVSLQGEVVSANLFALLGVHPALGRGFRPEEDQPGADGGTDAVVISHALFEQRFGGQPATLGTTITLSGKPYTVVGAAPPGFDFPPGNDPRDYWITSAAYAEPEPGKTPIGANRDASFLAAIGRLRPGVTTAAARGDLDRIAATIRGPRHLSDVYPDASILNLHDAVVGDFRPALLLLWASVAMVLLVACANLAGLGLARGLAKLPELRLRAALGAQPRDLLVAVLWEAGVLAAAGGTIGCALAVPAVHFMAPKVGPGFELAINGTVLLYAAALAAAALALFGSWPAVAAMRGAATAPGQGITPSRRQQRGRAALVVAEVSLTFMLVAAAGLLGRSLVTLQRQDPGFNPHQVLTFRLILPESLPRDRRAAKFQELLDRLRALPGVRSAAVAAQLPWALSVTRTTLARAFGQAVPRQKVRGFDVNAVGGNYLATLQIPLRRGRAFTAADAAGAGQVALVNEDFVHQVLSGHDPLGERLTPNLDNNAARIVVGVVGNVRAPGQPPDPILYLPYAQEPMFGALYVALRAERGDPMALLPTVRHQVQAANPDWALVSASSLDAYGATFLQTARMLAWLMGVFGALAMLLALTGLYGLVAYSVRQRQREFGVRIALGATPGDLYRLVLGAGLRLAACGLLLGGLGLIAIRGWLASQLYGVGALDPVTLGAVAAALIAAALLAAWSSAHRAARTDPMQALRQE